MDLLDVGRILDLGPVTYETRKKNSPIFLPISPLANAQQAAGGRGQQAVSTAEVLDFIDIPTFLRRQAD